MLAADTPSMFAADTLCMLAGDTPSMLAVDFPGLLAGDTLGAATPAEPVTHLLPWIFWPGGGASSELRGSPLPWNLSGDLGEGFNLEGDLVSTALPVSSLGGFGNTSSVLIMFLPDAK